ncbi:aminotransferase DegT [Candidatus Daviesbacteria bacterium RIFCSPHIGHO2_02_FULL_41_14]|uniref:Aminotransferase DegT n=1 Tax=Candidatus Daviesbacteria bacterium RIFCSPLOWO2_01_FULL_40_24 TaxID=1797787 RepID=A0A1F5MJA3_9BACT|nr:MAG: aminotransferase DegT [Candidatus Daviesbacteria bacterium RIFCSPHIGHO2_02_FULL_41_14]OGE65451.1 MAG: aminotransferase DegT [Candidatus Daviesbacteria bacterium RIFCSPLOWO2_01_FULL_40_24]
MTHPIPIAKPIITQKEINEVVKVLRSGHLSQGKWVEEFEKDFAKFIGSKFAIATSSGTAALYLALLSLGIKAHDEVVTTSFSFIASSNAIIYLGAKPVFVDINPHTYNIDTDLIEKYITPRTRAILPVHLYGLPADMIKVRKIAKRYNLIVIEDACQAHGASIKSKKVGTFGDAGCFSFYPTKNMTTGEGGVITTNSAKLAKKIKLLREHGMRKRYHHEILGFNFRMTNISAALGIEQLKKLPEYNLQRVKNAAFLTSRLSPIKQLLTPSIPNGFNHVFHQYTIQIRQGKIVREKLMQFLSQNGVSTVIYYPIPIHKQKFMKQQYKNLNLVQTQAISQQVLSLPVHPNLSYKELQKITDLINLFYKNQV